MGIISTMKALIITDATRAKLTKKHFVDEKEIRQCFVNRTGPLLIDERENHATTPPTLWFLARTNSRRLLKVVYIQTGPNIEIRTCYEPNEVEIKIYTRHTNHSE